MTDGKTRGGRKGRSGPPGNLNATRHPWRVFWKRRALRPEDRWVLPVLESYGEALIADKGGADNITAGEKRMVEIAQVARACSMLILAEAQRRGLIKTDKGDWDLSTGFKELPKFLQLERQALQGLGLERRQRIKSLEDLLAEPESGGNDECAD